MTLRHPLAATTEMRVPLADLQDPVQGQRLELLRRDGVQLQAMALGEEEALQRLDRFGGADSLELRLPRFLVPVGEALRRLGAANLPLVLYPVLAGDTVDAHHPHGSEVITCGKATLVIPGPTEHPVGDLLEPDIARRRVCRLAVGLVRDLEDDQSASPTGGPLLIYLANSDSGLA